MSSIIDNTIPGYFEWPRTGKTVQKVGFDVSPTSPKDGVLPSGKYAIMEYNRLYTEHLINGEPPILQYGATHVAVNQFPTSTNITSSQKNAGLVGDGWAYVQGGKTQGALLSTVPNITLFTDVFYQVCGGFGGSANSVNLHYQVMILDGEDWSAFSDNTAGSKVVLDAMVAKFDTWKIDVGKPNTKLGIWGVSSAADILVDLTAGNLAAKTTAYKTGGTHSIYSQSGFGVFASLRYDRNNLSNFLYEDVFKSDISVRINPSGKEVWSVWTYGEFVQASGADWTSETSGIHSYKRTDGSDAKYVFRSNPNPYLFYTYCLLGLFWYDGIYVFGDYKGTYNKDHIERTAGESLLSIVVGDDTIRYEDFMGVMDFAILAINKAVEYKTILEDSTSWIIPEFSLDGGSSWYTGDDRLVPNCALNGLPLIKIKYNSGGTQAVVLAVHPDLNTPGNLTQDVVIRNGSIENTFQLKSIKPYIGTITI